VVVTSQDSLPAKDGQYLMNNHVVLWPEFEPMTNSRESDDLTTKPPNHHEIDTKRLGLMHLDTRRVLKLQTAVMI